MSLKNGLRMGVEVTLEPREQVACHQDLSKANLYSTSFSLPPSLEMTPSATRPPWLYATSKLEEFVELHNPILNISKLRHDRNGCKLVDDILDEIIKRLEIEPPGAWEMNLARIHLAVDLQHILQRWCSIGVQKTLEGSVLRDLFSSEIVSDFRHPMDLEAKTVMPKMETESLQNTVFSPTGTRPHYSRPPGEEEMLFSYNSVVDNSRKPSFAKSRPGKRLSEDVDLYPDATKVAKIAKTEFICPYYSHNQNMHVECAEITFPNPRKLKEHVWRFTKPFKCVTCGEGFGREKTRAIHREQRKTKCTKSDTQSIYEGSPEHERDRGIENAKSTQDMIGVFATYERAKESSQTRSPGYASRRESLLGYRDSTGSESQASPLDSEASPTSGSETSSDGEMSPETDGYPQDLGLGSSQINNFQLPPGQYKKDLDIPYNKVSDLQLGMGQEVHGRPRRKSFNSSGLNYLRIEQNTPDSYFRGKSAPADTSAPTSIPFDQLHVVPEIVVTESEPIPQRMNNQNIDVNGAFSHDSYYYHSSEGRQPSYGEASMEDGIDPTLDPSYVMSTGDSPTTQDFSGAQGGPRLHSETEPGYVHSGGWGAFRPFDFRINMHM